MASHSFGAYIDVEPSGSGDGKTPNVYGIPVAPQKAKPRSYHSVPLTPSDIELENMNWGDRYNGPHEISSNPPSGVQTPRVTDLEMSRPASPVNQTEALQSIWYPKMNKYRMISVCLANFCSGLSDSAPGALIPYMEKHYDIGYAIVSLIFITNAAGFISAALFVDALRARLGRAKTLMLASFCMAAAYVPVVCTPPFPVVVAAFFLLGFGMAVNLALGNVFAANLQNGTTMLGFMHGSYGIGGTIGPLIATSMVAKGNLVWSRYYFIPLGVTLFNGGWALWSFWSFESESSSASPPTLLTNIERIASRTQNAVPLPKEQSQFRGMLKSFKSKIILLGALFIFAYQGSEVSISGWVISFLIATRGGDPSSVGYVTSGFWGGITVGRFLLSPVGHKVGEKLFVYIIVVGAAAFQLLVWFVPNIIGNAVAVSIVGLLLGPVYPCSCTVFTRLIPRKEQVSGLSLISAFGSSGGAVAPFTTGILAQAAGTFVLHPIAIGLFGVMIVCWFTLPNVKAKEAERDE